MTRPERIKMLERFYDSLNCLECCAPHAIKVVRGSLIVVLQPETVELMLEVVSKEISIERRMLASDHREAS